MALKSQDKPYKLFFNVGKEETNWYMGEGGGVTCPGRFISPPPRFFMLILFSSPSIVQPNYKIKVDLKSQDKSNKLVFNDRKNENNWYMGESNLSRAVYLVPHPGF